MTHLKIAIIDIHHDNEEVELEDLTTTGAEMLIHDCEQLLSNLRDKMYEEE
jgi:hypothetical protein